MATVTKKTRKPSLSGQDFAKNFESVLQDARDPKTVFEALFNCIVASTESVITKAKEEGVLDNASSKGIVINLPGFKQGGEDMKYTAKFTVKMSKTKKGGNVPRIHLSFHPKFKKSLDSRLIQALQQTRHTDKVETEVAEIF